MVHQVCAITFIIHPIRQLDCKRFIQRHGNIVLLQHKQRTVSHLHILNIVVILVEFAPLSVPIRVLFEIVWFAREPQLTEVVMECGKDELLLRKVDVTFHALIQSRNLQRGIGHAKHVVEISAREGIVVVGAARGGSEC